MHTEGARDKLWQWLAWQAGDSCSHEWISMNGKVKALDVQAYSITFAAQKPWALPAAANPTFARDTQTTKRSPDPKMQRITCPGDALQPEEIIRQCSNWWCVHEIHYPSIAKCSRLQDFEQDSFWLCSDDNAVCLAISVNAFGPLNKAHDALFGYLHPLRRHGKSLKCGWLTLPAWPCEDDRWIRCEAEGYW